MDVRIGVIHTGREVEVELPNDTDRDELKARIAKALEDDDNVLWLTDRHGKDLAMPSGKIAYIEVGSQEVERRIGFGAG
ncbi:MAG: DUF3107 domain-containing protein [Acidimicrobiales bacterium]|nr:DUF3107 domain-containing protein [Acidimicrobiales bacterium]